MTTDGAPLGVLQKTSDEEDTVDSFLPPSQNRRVPLRHLTNKGHPRRLDQPSKPIKRPLKLGLKDSDDGSDVPSDSSYSILSDDTDDDVPRSPPPRIERLTIEQETIFFNEIYNIISDAFDEWEAELKEKGITDLSVVDWK